LSYKAKLNSTVKHFTQAKMNNPDLDSYIACASELHQITLSPAQLERVKTHLSRTMTIAEKLIDFPFLDADELVEIYRLVD